MALTTLESAIASDAADASVLTQEGVEALIEKVEYYIPNGFGGTLCHITLHSGYVVRGETSCPLTEEAQTLAFTDAMNKLWELCRFSEVQRRHAGGGS